MQQHTIIRQVKWLLGAIILLIGISWTSDALINPHWDAGQQAWMNTTNDAYWDVSTERWVNTRNTMYWDDIRQVWTTGGAYWDGVRGVWMDSYGDYLDWKLGVWVNSTRTMYWENMRRQWRPLVIDSTSTGVK